MPPLLRQRGDEGVGASAPLRRQPVMERDSGRLVLDQQARRRGRRTRRPAPARRRGRSARSAAAASRRPAAAPARASPKRRCRAAADGARDRRATGPDRSPAVRPAAVSAAQAAAPARPAPRSRPACRRARRASRRNRGTGRHPRSASGGGGNLLGIISRCRSAAAGASGCGNPCASPILAQSQGGFLQNGCFSSATILYTCGSGRLSRRPTPAPEWSGDLG